MVCYTIPEAYRSFLALRMIFWGAFVALLLSAVAILWLPHWWKIYGVILVLFFSTGIVLLDFHRLRNIPFRVTLNDDRTITFKSASRLIRFPVDDLILITSCSPNHHGALSPPARNYLHAAKNRGPE